MPRSRFRPLFPALALGVTLVLGFASAAAVAQTGVAQIEADGMPLRLVYPTAARARPQRSRHLRRYRARRRRGAGT